MLRAAAFAVSLVACGGQPLRNFGDGGIVDAPPPDFDADAAYFDAPDAGACSLLATFDPDIVAVNEVGTAPASTGGAIADASYRLSSIHNHGDSAQIVRQTLRFAGTTFERASRDSGDTEDDLDAGTWSTIGTQVTLDVTCGDLLVSRTFGFSLGPDTLELTRTGINGAVVFAFDELP